MDTCAHSQNNIISEPQDPDVRFRSIPDAVLRTLIRRTWSSHHLSSDPGTPSKTPQVKLQVWSFQTDFRDLQTLDRIFRPIFGSGTRVYRGISCYSAGPSLHLVYTRSTPDLYIPMVVDIRSTSAYWKMWRVFEIFEESRELLRCFEVVDRLLL